MVVARGQGDHRTRKKRPVASLLPSKRPTGPAPPRRSVCAPGPPSSHRRPAKETTVWLRTLFRTPKLPSHVQKGRRPVTLRPQVEPLEDRTVPAVLSPITHVADPPAEQAARSVTVMTRNL